MSGEWRLEQRGCVCANAKAACKDEISENNVFLIAGVSRMT